MFKEIPNKYKWGGAILLVALLVLIIWLRKRAKNKKALALLNSVPLEPGQTAGLATAHPNGLVTDNKGNVVGSVNTTPSAQTPVVLVSNGNVQTIPAAGGGNLNNASPAGGGATGSTATTGNSNSTKKTPPPPSLIIGTHIVTDISKISPTTVTQV